MKESESYRMSWQTHFHFARPTGFPTGLRAAGVKSSHPKAEKALHVTPSK
eukprot:IDg10393t1